VLPAEIASTVLQHAILDPSDGIATLVVGRFVCRQWYELLECLRGPLIAFRRKAYNFNVTATSCGYFSLLQWGVENGCGLYAGSNVFAAERGDLEMLKWLKEKGCDQSMDMSARAAQNGHLEVLEWMREAGCDWNQTCSGAAFGGQLEVLKYLRKKGCPWSADTCVEE